MRPGGSSVSRSTAAAGRPTSRSPRTTSRRRRTRSGRQRLKKIHKDIHGANGSQEARSGPGRRSTRSRTRGPSCRSTASSAAVASHDQLILIQVLGQIDKPLSSKVLAMLAVYGKTPDVRRRATEILRGRPSRGFPRPARRPDDRSAQVRGETRRRPRLAGRPVRRGREVQRQPVLRATAAPNITPQPGDIITYDQSGMPVISRPVGCDRMISTASRGPGFEDPGAQTNRTSSSTSRSPPPSSWLEAQRGAVVAEAQLEADVALIKSINDGPQRASTIWSWRSRRTPPARTAAARPRNGATPSLRATTRSKQRRPGAGEADIRRAGPLGV